jgi:hypothetical protein
MSDYWEGTRESSPLTNSTFSRNGSPALLTQSHFFTRALALGFSLAERLPSADRSQQILNSAGRHRDSAARLCSIFPFRLSITYHPEESRTLSGLDSTSKDEVALLETRPLDDTPSMPHHEPQSHQRESMLLLPHSATTACAWPAKPHLVEAYAVAMFGRQPLQTIE